MRKPASNRWVEDGCLYVMILTRSRLVFKNVCSADRITFPEVVILDGCA